MTAPPRSDDEWPTRRHSLRLMWRHRRGIGVVGGHHLSFAWELLRLRRSDWYLWAASMRAWEELGDESAGDVPVTPDQDREPEND